MKKNYIILFLLLIIALVAFESYNALGQCSYGGSDPNRAINNLTCSQQGPSSAGIGSGSSGYFGPVADMGGSYVDVYLASNGANINCANFAFWNGSVPVGGYANCLNTWGTLIAPTSSTYIWAGTTRSGGWVSNSAVLYYKYSTPGTPSFSSAPTPVCTATSQTYTINATAYTTSYSWSSTTQSGSATASIPGGSATSKSITFSGSGVVRITVVSSNNGKCTASNYVDVTVSPEPVMGSYAYSQLYTCDGYTKNSAGTTVTNSMSGSSGTQAWYWGTSGGAWNYWGTTAGNNCFPPFPSSGEADRMRCDIQSPGCTSVQGATVLVSTSAPSISSVTAASSPICGQSTTTLTANSPSALGGATIQWYTGTGGTGNLLGSGSTLTVGPGAGITYFARVTDVCNGTAPCASGRITSPAQASTTVAVESTLPTVSASNISLVNSPSNGCQAAGQFAAPSFSDNCSTGASGQRDIVFGVSNCKLWVRADAGVIKDGSGNVAQWTDLSGTSNHFRQTDFTRRPTLTASSASFNGNPAITFNTSQFMTNVTNIGGTAYTIFTVARMTGGANARLISSASTNWLLGYWGGAKDKAYFNNWITSSASTPTADAVAHMYSATSSGTGANGTLVYDYGAVIATGTAGTPNNPGILQLNSYSNGLSEPSNGEVAEIIYFDRVLTAAERQSIEGYLAEKYNLTAPLASHKAYQNFSGGESRSFMAADAGGNILRTQASTTVTSYTGPTITTPVTPNCTSMDFTVSGMAPAGNKLVTNSGSQYLCVGGTGSCSTSGPWTSNLAIGSNSTIEAWFNASAIPANPSGFNTLIRGTTNQHHIIIDRAFGQIGVWNSGFFSSGFNILSAGLTGWHHLAAVGTGGKTIFYLDGIKIGTSNTQATENIVAIGNYMNGGQGFGEVDEVRIWNVALAQNTISSNMAKGITNTHPSWNSLVAYYKMDNSGANSATGSSACGSCTGTLVSGATYNNLVNYYTYNWTLPSGTASPGLSTTSETLTITGASTGNYIYSVYASANSCNSTTISGNINLPINTAGAASSNPSLCINTVLPTVTIATTGATGISNAGVSGANGLPAGVSATWAANTITISGTPTASGTFNYSIPLTGGCGNINGTGTITVSANNTASVASSSPTLCINTVISPVITHVTTVATGISNAGVSGANGLPAGVSATWASNAITISGTPTASGTFNYSIPLTGGCSTANATGTIIVTPDNTVGSASSNPTLCINTVLPSVTFTTTGATGITGSGLPGVNGLPAGVSATWAANTITLSGTPSASGTFNYSIPLTGGCGNINATGTITVTADNTVGAPSSNPTLCINTPLTAITISTTGATGISNNGVSGANGLPSGVSASWSGNTITITGTPTTNGTFNYSIPLTGGCGTLNATGTITVSPDNTAGAPSSNPTLCINTLLPSITIATTGATGVQNASVSGANGLPLGVGASWSGNVITISGTPTQSGTFNYSIPLTGGCGSINATGTITVTPNNTAGAPSSTASSCINVSLSAITLSTTGATGISDDGVAGANGLPPGVSASWSGNTITLSGTPTSSGVYGYIIPLTGGCGIVNAVGTLTISPDNGVSAASASPTLCINTPLLTAVTHTTTGATGILNDGISGANGLPAGVSASWSGNTITISGTPTASGTFTYSIPLTGGCGSLNATGTISVTPDNTAGTPSSSPTSCINAPITTITIPTTGASGVANSGVSGANGLPSGVNASWAGNNVIINGTGLVSGTFNYTIPLTGGCGTVSATGSLTVNPDPVGGTISGGGITICLGSSTGNLILTGSAGVVQKWQRQLNLGGYVDIPATAGLTTYSEVPSSSGIWNYRAVVESAPCVGTEYSTSTTVSVDQTSVGGTTSVSPTTYCAGASVSISLTGTTGGISGWEESSNGGVTWAPIPSTAGLSTYNYIANTGGNFSYRAVVTNGICPASNSSQVNLIIDPACTFTWLGFVSSNWYDGANWSGGIVPTVANDIIIPDQPNDPGISVPGVAGCKDILMSNGANLNINAGCTLNIAGTTAIFDNNLIQGDGTISFVSNAATSLTVPINFEVNRVHIEGSTNVTLTGTGQANMYGILKINGSLTSNNKMTFISNSSGTALIDGSGTGGFTSGLGGVVTVQRRVLGGNGYKYISAAVDGCFVSDWTDDFGIQGADNFLHNGINFTNPWPTLWRYDETVTNPSMTYGWYSHTDPGNVLDRMKGYAGIMPSSLLDLTGSVRNGTQNTTVTHTSSGVSLSDGWNLMGNPYISPINFASVYSLNSGIAGTVYYWTSSGTYIGQYATYNALTNISTNGGSAIIPSSQGFFIKKSSAGSQTFTLNNSVRTTDLNPTFFKLDNNFKLLRLQSEFDGATDEMVILEEPTGLEGYDDKFDSWKFMAFDPTMSNIYSVGLSPQEILSVNALPKLIEGRVIPIGYKAGKPGIHQIKLTEIQHFEGQSVYLEDRKLGLFFDLGSNLKYEFIQNPNDSEVGRFYLRIGGSISSTPLNGTDLLVNLFDSENGMLVQAKGNISNEFSFKVVDISGKLILGGQDSFENGEAVIKVGNVAATMYFVIVEVDGQTFSGKMIKK